MEFQNQKPEEQFEDCLDEDDIEVAKTLNERINERVMDAQQLITEACTHADEKKLPRRTVIFVLDIDDTAIYSEFSFHLLFQDKNSPFFDQKSLGLKFESRPIKPVLNLVHWAKRQGIKLIFLTARTEKNFKTGQDCTYLHRQLLEVAGYPKIDGEQICMICLPHEIKKMSKDVEGTEQENEIIGQWKKEQLMVIEKQQGHIAAVLDDQERNLRRKTHFTDIRIPSLLDPPTPRQ
jgi:hypothetical protein